MKIGDVFKIKTNIGFGYLQYVETDDLGIDFVRVLEPISANGEITQAGVDQTERWNIGFPLKTAARRKIVEMVGNFEIPKSFVNSEFARSEHNIRGEFLGWHIVHKSTLKRELKSDLDEKNLKLSPHGIMNDTLIVERLEQNWRLENWK
ncbi:hypothetical protein [Flavobacterium terrigena]|uniref:Immunity protein 26 n=1 Tax=Flavobacterium terrigena TaxID=402734 RepID=A0A1H6WCI4_9FLAO|nr:hypothetical protein [Flavobacterium terrigena]SEJ10035.1 hypothetical protein SAMN05660918_2366 [Flavobacterium terrigena]